MEEPKLEQKTPAGGECSPEEIALKSFFLGPQAENAGWVRELVDEMFDAWFQWRRTLYSDDGAAISEGDRQLPEFIKRRETISKRMGELVGRLQNEVPSFSPRYIGHMLTEISIPALLGHIVTLLHNPNNLSGEASRVGIVIEDEAISDLLVMLGFDPQEGTGHFTSGGTIANLEAALRARDRYARWLAAGAVGHSYEFIKSDMVSAGLMGWDDFDKIRNSFELTDAETARFHILKGNPVSVYRELNQVFGEDYAGPVMIIPENKHYSWNKCVDILGMGEEAFIGIETDETGSLCIDSLRKILEQCREHGRPPIMVVSVAGTTELGEMDPVDQVQDVLDEFREKYGWHIWHHVDAAYGGFFCSMDTTQHSVLPREAASALNAINRSNSVTIDPHKLGYVPYASGAFLCKNRREYFYKKSIAPYINFAAITERGPQTIEGSRSAAGAVSTWLTARTIGLTPDGYGKILERSIRSRIKLEGMLREVNPKIRVFPHSTTNIITFCVAGEHEALGRSNQRTLQIYKAFSPDTNHDFFVSKTTLKKPAYTRLIDDFTSSWKAVHDTGELVLIRLTIMNPFFDTKENNVDYPAAFAASLNEKIKLADQNN